MLTTTTGSFPIGIRRGWSEWQKHLESFLSWAKENHLGVVDLGADLEDCRQTIAFGLHIGSADLLAWKQLISPDLGVRKEGVAKAARHIGEAATLGIKHFFCVMLPEKPELKRSENFAFMVESFAALAPVLEKHHAAVVIEGWPGPGALCCTPESLRAFFKQVPSPAMALNFDPSHLVRMNIDPVRFLEEFAPRVRHAHGKDTEFLTENLYDLGTEIQPTFAEPIPFGGNTWRYTIPGQGNIRWHRLLWILKNSGYQGAISIELEDAHFNGTPDGEKRGILAAAKFLESC